MSTPRLFETFFSMSSGHRKRDKPSLYEQEHGPLQMFGPANGVSNYLALEKGSLHVDSSDSCVLAT